MIGIFDSGIGGLTILAEIKKAIKHNNIIYYADSINNPYGDKNDKELKIITSKIVDFFIKENIKVIVIACNTATTRCITYLREKYPNIIFIGTEPAIKVACEKNHHNILVLGTTATINSFSVSKLIKTNKRDNQNIYIEACKGLANAIETNNVSKIDDILKKHMSKYENIDSIVLGCTHYPYIKDKIKKYYPKAKVYDSSKGVAKELKRKLLENNILINDGKQKVTIIKNA